MKIRSFRMRIAMLSVFCSSLVLLGSSLVTLHLLWSSELYRVDRFIGNDVQRNLEGEDFRPPGPPPIEPRRIEDHRPGRHAPWERPPWDRPPRRSLGDDRKTSGPAFLFLFRDRTDHSYFRSENWPASLDEARVAAAENGAMKFSTVLAGGTIWRVAAGSNADKEAIVGVDLEMVVTVMKQVASAFLLSIPVALLLIAGGAVFIADRALRPVHDLTRLVERITARGLGERVESRVKDAEFEKLILVFNEMMDRLERSFTQANRFSADAAHELRTPITILQGQVERMLLAVPSGSETQQDLGGMIDEIHRIKSILEKLLLLARMDAGQFQMQLAPVCLSQNGDWPPCHP
jgi:signal transduction histidine kinase